MNREPDKEEGPHLRRRLNQLLLLDHLLLDLLLDHLLDLLDHLLHNLRLPHIPLILFLAHPFLATSKLKITLSRIFLHPVRQYFHHPVRHSAHSPPGKPLHYCRPAPSLFCCPEFPRRPAGHPHLPIESPRAPKVPDGRRLKAPELPRFARSGRAASIREVLRVWIFFRSQLDAFNCNAVSFLMHAVVHCIGASYIKERYYAKEISHCLVGVYMPSLEVYLPNPGGSLRMCRLLSLHLLTVTR